MRTLIVGIGALGGVVAGRLTAAGAEPSLAVRTAESAAALRATALNVSGIGGAVTATPRHVATIADYLGAEPFELIVLATKADEALRVAPMLTAMLASGGTLLPIQNGAVSQLLIERFGSCVLGGLSNLGATMSAPGFYEQRNAGHLLIGELAGGEIARTRQVRDWLGRGVEVRVTANMQGAIWSKLIVNCSVTTIGAIAASTMRGYIATPEGRQVFEEVYDEALAVALASGARPEVMLVNPIPPQSGNDREREAWLGTILNAYGDLKPSMLQDFERGNPTEIAFINDYVVRLGERLQIPTPANSAIVRAVRRISAGEIAPGGALLQAIAAGLPRVTSPAD